MDEKALFSISCGLYVVGVKGEAWPGGCIVDALIQSTAVPATLILCSVARSGTNAAIKATGEFSVSVLREDVDPFVIANFGFVSARAVDKWANVPWEAFCGLPVLKQAAARYVCRVQFTREMGSHTLFHCDIVEAEPGAGVPLSYGHYREHLKDATVKAFQAWKKSRM
jgi:flavin reductase (DIM6/NTAB) family NADH-FMN oxidoreductase RutF